MKKTRSNKSRDTLALSENMNHPPATVGITTLQCKLQYLYFLKFHVLNYRITQSYPFSEAYEVLAGQGLEYG
jgi:hypothetical protein